MFGLLLRAVLSSADQTNVPSRLSILSNKRLTQRRRIKPDWPRVTDAP